MSAYRSAAVWGGTGNLGPSIVNHLISAGLDVTVLSRTPGTPAGVSDKAKVVQVDVTTQHDKVVSTLRGVDAVISATGSPGLASQPALIDAAIEAGVKFFIPSEFGCDTSNKLSAALPVFAHKVKVQEYLRQRAEQIGHVLINNGAFLDWGLEKNFIVNITSDDAPNQLYNGGDVKFSATTLDDVGKAVVGVLKDPKSYWNRQVLINSTITTQNALLAALKKAKPEGKWDTQVVQTEDIRKDGLQKLQSGQGDIGAIMVGFLRSGLFDPAYGGEFDQTDSKKLGLKYLSQDEVDRLVVDIANKKNAA